MVRHSSSSSLGGHEYRARSKGRTFLAQHAKSVKHCVANGLQAATVKQLPKRALSEGAKLKNIVQVLPECLRQYNTCSALQRSNKGVSLGIQNKLHSPNEWPAGYHPIRKRNSRSMCADFAAHGRPGLSNRECHWIAPVLLAAVQPSPCPYRTRQTSQRTGHRTANTNKNKRIQRANVQKIRAGREDVTVARCVFTDGASSTLQSLVTQLAENRHSNKTHQQIRKETKKQQKGNRKQEQQKSPHKD